MTDTFTWRATRETTGQISLRKRGTPFGDGYAQSAADGLNHVVATWSVQFAGSSAEITALTHFLDQHVGLSFFYKPMLRAMGLYQCDGYDIGFQGGDVYTVRATFIEYFNP